MQATTRTTGLRWIAHRGNLEGPTPGEENTAAHLERALGLGFDVECDVVLRDGELWLGHDRPEAPTSVEFLSRPGVWCHAKTVETLGALVAARTPHCFFQADDEVALTSRGFLWTHSRCPVVTPRSVVTIVDFDETRLDSIRGAAAICSDHIVRWRETVGGRSSPLVRFRDCGLLVLDVDGVLTDGTKVYDHEAAVVGKRFHDHDFTAIKRFAERGVHTCLLTADRSVTEAIARKRGIDFWYARRDDGTIDKPSLLPELQAHYRVERDRIAYVGDDVFDLPLVQELDMTFCPSVAPRVLRDAVACVLQRRGGDGLIAELFEIYESLTCTPTSR